jgi:hypothetical protein
MFDFSKISDMFGNSGSFDYGSLMSMMGDSGGDAGNGWSYWAKAIQDGVIGQSAGFDSVKQNTENEPLAMEARGEDPKNAPAWGSTRGDYVYNYEDQVPFLKDLSKSITNDQSSDPLRDKGSTGATKNGKMDAVTQNGQNNASGSNAALDKSLSPEARKVAAVGEGGATPQVAKDTSFNSMMDSFGDMHLPLDNPKSRKELMGEGSVKKEEKGNAGSLIDALGANTNSAPTNSAGEGAMPGSSSLQNVDTSQLQNVDWSQLQNMDWSKWLSMFGGN